MDRYLEYIKQVMAIAHTGLTYSKDPYALENYEVLLNLSKTMLYKYTKEIIPRTDLFHDQRYPTPQPTVRVVIMNEGSVLFVKEKIGPSAGLWSLPGGWVDIGQSIAQAALAEGQEESGYPIQLVRLVAILDRSNYIDSDLYDTFTLVFLAEVTGEYQGHNFEIEEIGWFHPSEWPSLSFKITTEELSVIMRAISSKEVIVE